VERVKNCQNDMDQCMWGRGREGRAQIRIERMILGGTGSLGCIGLQASVTGHSSRGKHIMMVNPYVGNRAILSLFIRE